MIIRSKPENIISKGIKITIFLFVDKYLDKTE